MGAPNFPIGVLSRQSGVNIETIRYYERVGLMPAPPRSKGRQRIYDLQHLRQLTFIRRGRELGFSIDQIRMLLGLLGPHELTCAEVKGLAECHIFEVRRKIRDLRRLERLLSGLAAQCHGRRVPDCPILEALADGG